MKYIHNSISCYTSSHKHNMYLRYGKCNKIWGCLLLFASQPAFSNDADVLKLLHNTQPRQQKQTHVRPSKIKGICTKRSVRRASSPQWGTVLVGKLLWTFLPWSIWKHLSRFVCRVTTKTVQPLAAAGIFLQEQKRFARRHLYFRCKYVRRHVLFEGHKQVQ